MNIPAPDSYLFYSPNGFPHFWPLLRIVVGAICADCEEVDHAIKCISVVCNLRIDEFSLPLLRNRGGDPLHHIGATLAIGKILRRKFTGHDFKNDNAKTINIRLGRDFLVLGVLRGSVCEHCLCRIVGVDKGMEGVVAQKWLIVVA